MHPNADSIAISFLEDGGATADSVAGLLASFLGQAGSTLDIAIYDCALTGSPADTIRQALQAAAGRGVTIRVAYFAGPHVAPGVPPPQPDGSAAFLAGCAVPNR